jgi:hypothetical protein
MTDWRALCAELLGALENEGHAHWPGGPDGDPLIEQARAALAQSETERSTGLPTLLAKPLRRKGCKTPWPSPSWRGRVMRSWIWW